uniref:Uncharacterized protein n=1 Tax=Cucumis sativus TaxID=3659 RepID=A0A0A0L2H6_CUCSA
MEAGLWDKAITSPLCNGSNPMDGLIKEALARLFMGRKEVAIAFVGQFLADIDYSIKSKQEATPIIFIKAMKMKTGVKLRMFELMRLSAVMEINQLAEDRSVTKTEYSSKSTG